MIELEDFDGTRHKTKHLHDVYKESKYHGFWWFLLALLLFWPLALVMLLWPQKGYKVITDEGKTLHIPEYEYNRYRDYKILFLKEGDNVD